MAEFNLGGNSLEKITEDKKDVLISNEQSEDRLNMPSDPVEKADFVSEPKVLRSLSEKELNDPDQINVTIADKNAPLVVLFGPPKCGKTMLLVRLTRFLKARGYTISPIKTFRPSYDEKYKYICEHYDVMINQTDAAKSTDIMNFMLVEILKDGRRLCQILEAPGEHYFDPTLLGANKDQFSKFPNYVNTIANSDNRKIWCVMLEPDWKDLEVRNNYVTRIHTLKQRMRPKDRTIFVFNKIDLTNFVISPGRINIKQARRDVENLYPGIFAPFRNMHPITRFFSEWRCDFVPFQTGDFTKSSTTLTYQEGPKEYPAKLWSIILKRING